MTRSARLLLTSMLLGGAATASVAVASAKPLARFCMQDSSDGTANVRAAPNLTAPVVMQLKGDTKLPMDGKAAGPGCEKNWAKLKLAKGRTVWACRAVLKCGTAEQLAPPPASTGGGASFTEVVTPAKVRLDVPYYYQYDNTKDPGGTCNITSAAMAIRYKGKHASPDGIYKDSQGLRNGVTGAVYDAEALATIGRQYGLKNSHALLGVGEKTIKTWLHRKVPFIMQGKFTSTRGHILLITGYDKRGWFINDPAGRWTGHWSPGAYSKNDKHQEGKSVHYTYAQVRANSLVSPTAFNGAILY